MSEIVKLLQQVNLGNNEAIVELVDQYMPLILCNSKYDDPQISEDCRQYIILNLVVAIKRFKPVLNYLYEENSK